MSSYSPVRRAGAASAVAVTGVALVLVLTYTVAPAWARGVGLDVWNYPMLRNDLQQVEQRVAEDEAKRENLRRQIEYGEHVAERLAAGALTLREAVDELEPVCRERVGFESVSECLYHAPTFRHGVARYLILRVEVLPTGDPAHRAAIIVHLEAEYAALGQ